MKKLWLFLMMLCLLTGLFAQFAPREQPVRGIAVQMDIYRYDQSQVRHLRLTDSRQIGTVLQHLRAMESRDTVETVPLEQGNNCTVLVHLVNGHRHLYRLRNGCYFCRDNGPWMHISPQLGRRFTALSEELADANPDNVISV